MKIKQLTTENAIIKTAQVEVKALTISGKQVTLAVFRQLPEEHILESYSLEMKGIIWGRVIIARQLTAISIIVILSGKTTLL